MVIKLSQCLSFVMPWILKIEYFSDMRTSPVSNIGIENSKSKEDDRLGTELTDPDLADSTTKKEPDFKGSKTEKSLIEDKPAAANDLDTNLTATTGEVSNKIENDPVIEMKDPNADLAASKIQAGFRGHQTRKQLILNQCMDNLCLKSV